MLRESSKTVTHFIRILKQLMPRFDRHLDVPPRSEREIRWVLQSVDPPIRPEATISHLETDSPDRPWKRKPQLTLNEFHVFKFKRAIGSTWWQELTRIIRMHAISVHLDSG